MEHSYTNVMPYNAEIKIAGNNITFKFYEKKQLYNYYVEPKNKREKTPADSIKEIIEDFKKALKHPSLYHKIKIKHLTLKRIIEEKKKERFIKSSIRARQNIFDLISSNVDKHLDYEGKKQTTKFLTLTFQENISDITEANQEFTKFLKRLSYHAYKTRKNVIKYIAVPELQKRGAWHFHIVLFNVKYIRWAELMEIWGHGGVYINALKKGMDGTEIAKYITKYITKALKMETKAENLSNYETYKKYGLTNKKRYYRSRGLYKPFKRKVELTSEEINFIKEILLENTEDEIYYKEYENEYRGKIKILSVVFNKEKIKEIKNFIKTLIGANREKFSRKYRINWEKIKEMRQKQIEEMILYDIESYYLYELSRYEKITGIKVG